MKNIRRGIGILALACAIGTVGACSGNNRTSPDWGPRVSRGTGSSGGAARNRARVKVAAASANSQSLTRKRASSSTPVRGEA